MGGKVDEAGGGVRSIGIDPRDCKKWCMRQPFEGPRRELLSFEGLSHSEEPGCRDQKIRDDDSSVEGYSPST